MISYVYGNIFCGLSIIENSNAEMFIVNEDLKILKKYAIDDFMFDCKDVVCDYIKLTFKHYSGFLKHFRDRAIKDFLSSEFYAQFLEQLKGVNL